MADAIRCDAGEWVEIQYTLLTPEERAAGLPEDTAAQPLRAWVKGFARTGAMIGDELEVETMSGRVVSGHLSAIEPGYSHTFGTPPPEIVAIGGDLRARVAGYRADLPAANSADDPPPSGAGE